MLNISTICLIKSTEGDTFLVANYVEDRKKKNLLSPKHLNQLSFKLNFTAANANFYPIKQMNAAQPDHKQQIGSESRRFKSDFTSWPDILFVTVQCSFHRIKRKVVRYIEETRSHYLTLNRCSCFGVLHEISMKDCSLYSVQCYFNPTGLMRQLSQLGRLRKCSVSGM